MASLQKQLDTLKTLELSRISAAKRYAKTLYLRKYETRDEWEERTKRYRFRCEKELRNLDAKIVGQQQRLQISIRKKESKKISSNKIYESTQRIQIEIRKKPMVFFQNSMIVLNFAELKYGIKKEDLLLLMHFYSEQRGFTEEEIKYKIILFTNSTRKRFELYVRKGYFKQFIKNSYPGGPVETDVYTLAVSITNLISKLYLIMIGDLSLDEFSDLRTKYPHIDNEFDVLKQEIINLKSRYSPEDYIQTIQEEH